VGSFDRRAGEDHDLRFGIFGHGTDRHVQGTDQLSVQGVSPRWPVEGDDPDPTVHLGQDHRLGIIY
jgi:hypothetical protein